MLVYSYDKTFEGLLSLIYDAYVGRAFPDCLRGPEDRLPLPSGTSHTVETRPEKADRVLGGLRRKLSREGVQRVMLAWLSEEEGSDWLIYKYIRQVFDSPRLLELDYADPLVLAVSKLARKVNGERHRMTGFLRFQKTGQDVYFAAFAPRHNILALLLPHFKERFADQRWLIYDAKRGLGVYYDGAELRQASPDPARLLAGGRLDAALLDEGEPLFQRLWQGYFSAANIEERANARLQARCLPQRFREYLTEMQGE